MCLTSYHRSCLVGKKRRIPSNKKKKLLYDNLVKPSYSFGQFLALSDHSQFWGWSLLPIDLIFVGSTKYPMSRPGPFPSLIYGSGRRFVRTWWISHELAIQLPHDGSRSTQTCFSILLVIQLTSSTKSHLFTGVPCPSQNPIQGSSNSAPTEMTCSKICHKLDC